MTERDQQSKMPIIRAFLGGTAVAFAMVGIALFWVSTHSNTKTTVLVNETKSAEIILAPVLNVTRDQIPVISEPENMASSENIFSATPKKVKSLSIETKPD